MIEDFNNVILFNNIPYLLREKGMKIGELEDIAGVSPGYIARTSKESNAKPSIDFICKVSSTLGVSIDTLLYVDISSLTPSERYIISFLEKLTDNTLKDKLAWGCESPDQLNWNVVTDEEGYCTHPLYQVKTAWRPTELEYPEEVTCPVFPSRTFDALTSIADDCFNLKMKNGATLYVMSICKYFCREDDPNGFAKEVWMCTQDGQSQFLCSSRDIPEISSLVEYLYDAICKCAQHPKMIPEVKTIIDAFMLDDLGD